MRPKPPRPNLPPVLLCALSLWASLVFSLPRMADASFSWCVVGACVAFAAALGTGAAVFRAHANLPFVLLLGVCLGGCLACSWSALQGQRAQLVVGQAGRWSFEAIADARENEFGTSCFAKVELENGDSAVVLLRFSEGAAIHFKDRFSSYAQFSKPSGASAGYCLQEGAVATARCFSFEKEDEWGLCSPLLSVRKEAIDAFGREGSQGTALLAALACGWRGFLDDDTTDAFRLAGVAHLIAVSGAHLSLLVGVLSAALRALRCPPRLSLAFQIAVISAYIVLSAAPISAIRAAVMVAAALFAPLALRRTDSSSSLALCILAFMCVNPSLALSVSFALSALSTLGIVLFAKLFRFWLQGVFASRLPFAQDAIALSFSSYVLALPLSAAVFSQISLVSPLANVVAAPFFAPLCLAALVLAALCALFPGASLLLQAACVLSEGFIGLLQALASLPHAAAPFSLSVPCALFVSFGIGAFLWLGWFRLSFRRCLQAGLALAVFFAGMALFPLLQGPSLTLFDVGQGDALLLSDGRSQVLIDTGTDDTALLEALARKGITTLDAVVISHHDDDHCGSLSSLKGVVELRRIIVAQDALTCPCEACASFRREAQEVAEDDALTGLSPDDKITVGRFELVCLSPERYVDQGGNEDSLVLLCELDCDEDGRKDWSALLTGDAETKTLEPLAKQRKLGAVDVLKVGHHGSKAAISEELLQVLQPSIALISVGENNRYGHPASQTLALLEACGTRVYRSDEQGEVVLGFEKDRIDVSFLQK